jgi:hypothetical protein
MRRATTQAVFSLDQARGPPTGLRGGYGRTVRRFVDNLAPLALGVSILIAPVFFFAALLRVICLV